MTTYQVTFRAFDDGRVLWRVQVNADLDGEAIEIATEHFHLEQPEAAAQPFLTDSTPV